MGDEQWKWAGPTIHYHMGLCKYYVVIVRVDALVGFMCFFFFWVFAVDPNEWTDLFGVYQLLLGSLL